MTAYLFDLDGTLVDTLPLIVQTSRLALAEFGLEIEDARIISLIGVPLLDTGEILLGPGRGVEYRECYQRHFRTIDSSHLAAFSGIHELLAALAAAGAKLACVTSKRQLPAENTLSQTGLRSYFPVLVSADNCSQHKPRPEPALLALSLLKAEDEPAIFIGDSVFDIGCAKNAGLSSCGVTWGAETEAGLLTAGADFIAHSREDLAKILSDFGA